MWFPSNELADVIFELLWESLFPIWEPFILDLGLPKIVEFALLPFMLSFLLILLALICCSLWFGLRMRFGANNAGLMISLRSSFIILIPELRLNDVGSE